MFKTYQITIAILVCTNSVVALDKEQTAAMSRSMSFLQQDGRGWFDGDIPIQKNACVSCHQVPSGIWAITAASAALEKPLTGESASLLRDAIDATEDPTVGVAAMWSQIKLAADTTGFDEVDVTVAFKAYILEGQSEDGRWPAKGQFPSQRRPIHESDAVVTMAMIYAYRSAEDAELSAALKRASKFVDDSKGSTTEYLAWKMLSATSKDQRAALGRRLIEEQNEDGGWGWRSGESTSFYSTGVATFALASSQMKGTDIARSIAIAKRFLEASRSDDGTWREASKLISKKPSPKLDYVYRYWATAWATLALATHYGAGDS